MDIQCKPTDIIHLGYSEQRGLINNDIYEFYEKSGAQKYWLLI